MSAQLRKIGQKTNDGSLIAIDWVVIIFCRE